MLHKIRESVSKRDNFYALQREMEPDDVFFWKAIRFLCSKQKYNKYAGNYKKKSEYTGYFVTTPEIYI